jgi:hypothetical protein
LERDFTEGELPLESAKAVNKSRYLKTWLMAG